LNVVLLKFCRDSERLVLVKKILAGGTARIGRWRWSGVYYHLAALLLRLLAKLW